MLFGKHCSDLADNGRSFPEGSNDIGPSADLLVQLLERMLLQTWRQCSLVNDTNASM